MCAIYLMDRQTWNAGNISDRKTRSGSRPLTLNGYRKWDSGTGSIQMPVNCSFLFDFCGLMWLKILKCFCCGQICEFFHTWEALEKEVGLTTPPITLEARLPNNQSVYAHVSGMCQAGAHTKKVTYIYIGKYIYINIIFIEINVYNILLKSTFC